MLQRYIILLLDDGFHFVEHLVDAWLHLRVVVLNVTHEFRQAPERISLRMHQLLLGEFCLQVILSEFGPFNRPLQENHQDGRSEVIYALDIGTGGVAHRPNEQESDEHGLHQLTSEQLHFGLGPVNVYFDLFEVFGFVS
jgi:hypothetical protein